MQNSGINNSRLPGNGIGKSTSLNQKYRDRANDLSLIVHTIDSINDSLKLASSIRQGNFGKVAPQHNYQQVRSINPYTSNNQQLNLPYDNNSSRNLRAQNDDQVIKYISQKLDKIFNISLDNLKMKKSLDQVEKYCATQILFHILLVSERTKLTQITIKRINQQLSTDLLSYFCIRYLINNDNIQQNSTANEIRMKNNNLIKKDSILNKQQGFNNYNKFIMELLNKIQQKQLQSHNLDLCSEFNKQFLAILQSLGIQVRNNDAKLKIQRRVSQNWKVYSKFQINSGCIQLNRQHLYFLQHWYQQLRSSLQGQNIINDKSLDLSSKELIISMLDKEKEQFYNKQSQFNKIREISFKNELQLIQQPIYSCFKKYPSKQKVSQFSSIMIIIYNNYLIKCINLMMDVLSKVQSKYKQSNKSSINSLNLINLSSLDIIQYTLYETQRKITDLIQKLQQETNSDIEIIEYKLSQGQQILRLEYKNKLRIKICLRVEAGQIECSQMLDKFVKKLIDSNQRFGPIMQLCKIWMNFQNASNFFIQKYQNIINIDYLNGNNIQLSQLENYQQYIYPFKCSTCGYFYPTFGQNHHSYNPQNNKYLCYPCRFYLSSSQQKVKMIPELKGKQLLKQIPLLNGVLINFAAKTQPVQFITQFYNKQYYLIDTNDEILFKFKEKKLPMQFIRQNIIIKSNLGQKQVQKWKSQWNSKKIQQQKNKQHLFQKSSLNSSKDLNRTSQKKIQLKCNQIRMGESIFQQPNVMRKNQSTFRRSNSPQFSTGVGNLLVDNNRLTVYLYNGQKTQKIDFLHFDKSRNHIKNMTISNCNEEILRKLTKQQLRDLSDLQLLQIEDINLKNLDDQIFFNFQALNVLKITSNSHLQNFHINQKYFKNLRKLELKFNEKLQELPLNLYALSSLIELHVEGTSILEFPVLKGCHSNIQTLKIISNRNMSKLPQNFGELKSLRSLTIQANDSLINLPISIGQLNNLKKITIKKNSMLQELPETIWKLKSIYEMIVQQNLYLQKLNLPNQQSNQSQLKAIKIEKNINLKQLSENFGNLKKLKQIVIEGNNLLNIPKSIGNFKMLTFLYISNTFITKLPEQFGDLRNLTNLTLNHNYQLQKLCQSFGFLQSLRTLNITNNFKLYKLPTSFGMLTKLESLNLKNNNLLELPESFGQLQSLTSLRLDLNFRLSKLPNSFGYLSKLNTLSFIQVKNLQNIPQDFYKLRQLKFIFTEFSWYKAYGQRIISLPGLRMLKIYYNQNQDFNQIEKIRQECNKKRVRFQSALLSDN